MKVHPELEIDWNEGCVCNVCRQERNRVRTVGNLWICNLCLKKQGDWWWDIDRSGEIVAIKNNLSMNDYLKIYINDGADRCY